MVEFAHEQGSLVYALYLGGEKPCEAEKFERDNITADSNALRLFKYYISMGVDGICFMPNRNSEEEIRAFTELARFAGFKHLANGMDVNKHGMPFTYFEYSCRPDLVDEALSIYRHESLRIKLPALNRATVHAISAAA